MSTKHALAALLFVFAMTTTIRAQGHWVTGRVGRAEAGRNYKLWLPAKYTAKRPLPLVLMLHGCTQTPEDFAAGTRMNSLADKHDFLVVYPEQPKEANPLKCWNWFAPEHQSRDKGEPALLADIVRAIQSAHRTDARRVYVAGISAGGAMAVIMGAAYPDLFAAVGVSAGLEYKAATSIPEALAAQKQGGPDPAQQGRLAYEAMRSAPGFVARGRLMPVIVFQGSDDGAVAPVNAEQVAAQWVATNDLLDDGADNSSVDIVRHGAAAGSGARLHDYEVNIYRDRRGRPLVERWLVKGLRHAWSGGSADGTFTDPKGPDASAEMWRFFSGFKR
ncbi:MAG TPA: PHB depolymerase family esterase [Pyrinomonadaceae bacterium]|jgi:poly(hydroxyalkanoate) depolymerase family esterase|nr:PHB depolymerase family esterase [Pyrinomonadaceae bacterium]